LTRRLPHLAEAADRIVHLTLSSPPTLGAGRLVCVDGPAGSGKTTLAAELARAFRDTLRGSSRSRAPGEVQAPAQGRAQLEPPVGSQVRSVHMDSLYAGWAGLEDGMVTLGRDVLVPLAAGAPGRYRRFDWHRMQPAEERLVEPCEVLVVEGVGSGGPALRGHAALITCLVWVDTPSGVRRARGLARDGGAVRAHWSAWTAQEDAMFARERTRERADLVVAGTGPA
jgi:energy-coupling factor transporter ATP-binding protein EcfA2